MRNEKIKIAGFTKLGCEGQWNKRVLCVCVF